MTSVGLGDEDMQRAATHNTADRFEPLVGRIARTDRIPADGWRVASDPLFQGSRLMAPRVLAAFASALAATCCSACPIEAPSSRWRHRCRRRSISAPGAQGVARGDEPVLARGADHRRAATARSLAPVANLRAGVWPGSRSSSRDRLRAASPPGAGRAVAAPIATAAATPASGRTATRVARPEPRSRRGRGPRRTTWSRLSGRLPRRRRHAHGSARCEPRPVAGPASAAGRGARGPRGARHCWRSHGRRPRHVPTSASFDRIAFSR